MQFQDKYDVVIVGAGPTGFMLALYLARAGISFLLVDKKSQVSTIMKATAISSLSLECFSDLNYAAPFEQTGIFTHALSVYIEKRPSLHLPWTGIDSKYPYACLLGQNYVEKFQYQLLQQMKGDVSWETGFKDYEEKQDQLRVSLEKNGQSFTVNCQYLIGCDGAKSKVREKAGIEQKGKKYPSHYMIADVELDGQFDAKDWYFFLAKKGFCSVGALPAHRWGILVSLPKNMEYQAGEIPTLEFFQQQFNELCSIPGTLKNPNWISHFHTYNKSVKQRRKGRVFLCGDAAHQVSPLTSLGMNSGILDATNLGWKLALVCRREAKETLLDSYDIEQRQTLKIVKQLSDSNERSFAMTGALTREIRDHLTELILNFKPVMKMFGGILSQTSIRIKKSPIIDEFIGMPIHLKQDSHYSLHGSCLKAWSTFGKGPAAGKRAPDVYVFLDKENSQPQWLFDHLLEGRHALIVFSGCEHHHEKQTETIDEILTKTEKHYSKWIKPVLILAATEKPEKLQWQGNIFYDHQQMIHQRYGASASCLYLIRPDRIIGFRSLPLRWDKLEQYLKRIWQ